MRHLVTTPASLVFYGQRREALRRRIVQVERQPPPFLVLQREQPAVSLRAAELTVEQHQLRQRQDAIRVALAATQDVIDRPRLSAVQADVFRRLSEIRREKQAEVSRREGTKAQWRALEREFQSTIRGLIARLAIRRELQRPFDEFASNGEMSRHLMQLFEADGDFYVDRAGPWMRLQLDEGEWLSTGLSRSHILAGDARLAALILVAVIDYHLHQPEARREDIEYVDGLFTLLRLASGAVERDGGERAVNERRMPAPAAAAIR